MFCVMEDKVADFLTNGTNYSLSEFSCGGVSPKVSGSDLSVKIWKSVKFLGEIKSHLSRLQNPFHSCF